MVGYRLTIAPTITLFQFKISNHIYVFCIFALMIEEFFSILSERFYNENDLSDFTWAMCQTSDNFLTAFLDFFFPNEKFGEIYLEREAADEDCRPDFQFEHEGKKFLIECKIGDRNHHFEQYIRHYKITPQQLGYITNYPMIKEGYVVHTWTEFYLFIKKQIPPEELELWNGYLKYLKSVCNIYIFEKPMNLDGMFSLYTFYRSLDIVFTIDNEKFSSELYDSRKDTNNGGNYWYAPRDGVMGKFFAVNFKHIRLKKTWGWMGVYFEREHPLICICFDYRENWGQPVYNLLLNKLDQIGKGNYFVEPYEEGGGIWFEFNKEKEFDGTNDLNSQILLLKSFFIEVLNTIYSLKTNF